MLEDTHTGVGGAEINANCRSLRHGCLCVRDPAEDVLNTQCGYDIRLKLELEQQGSIYTKGCVGQFEKWLQDNLIVVAGVLVGIALLQIFGLCLAQNLVSDIKAVKANW